MADQINVGIIGAGAVSDFHHIPGIEIDPRAKLTAVCDPNEELLAQRKTEWPAHQQYTDANDLANDPNVDAVIIATPNFTHLPLTLKCIEAGKHVMCEKPLGLNFEESAQMYRAARDKGVRHMTAFTYRFAPSMRYVKHLIETGSLGEPRHFRSQRFLEWPETSWGWRQSKELAGAGDLFDMTIHRIDFAQDMLGPIKSICGAVAQFAKRDKQEDGTPCAPSEVDDWSSLIGRFESGAVGVWEGSTLMKGYNNDGVGYEWAEVNGSEGSAVYQLTDPNHYWIGRPGGSLEKVAVPEDFLVYPGSPRPANEGQPSTVFRYDLVYEFISAIVEERDAVPGFDHGATAQAIADAVLVSSESGRWVDIDASLD